MSTTIEIMVRDLRRKFRHDTFEPLVGQTLPAKDGIERVARGRAYRLHFPETLTAEQETAVYTFLTSRNPADRLPGNRGAIDERLADDLATQLPAIRSALDALIAKPNAQIGPADIKDLARTQRRLTNTLARLIRASLDDYSGTE